MEKKKPNSEKREERKSKTSVISFFICLGISIILMIGSAIVPPPFVVDESIFKCVGWLFGFAALGQLPAVLDADKWAKITHGNTTVVVGDKDDMDRRHHKFPHFEEHTEEVEVDPDDIGEGSDCNI